jgi:hypothetical protein
MEKGPDQQSILICFSNRDVKPTFNRRPMNCQQQIKRYSLMFLMIPIADYLDSRSSINPRIFLPGEDYFYPLFKPLFCMIWLPLFFGSRSSMMLVNQFLTWLHWKHDFT